MFGRIGLPELIVIFFVVILLFGAKALPEVAKGLAQAIKMFKKETREITENLNSNDEAPKPIVHETVIKDPSNDFDPNKERRDWRPQSPSETKES